MPDVTEALKAQEESFTSMLKKEVIYRKLKAGVKETIIVRTIAISQFLKSFLETYVR